MANQSLPPLPLPSTITESYLQSHDLNYHMLSAGSPSNPLLLLLHGFPEIAYSWRKIMTPLAEAGYYVVAYDQRGYGRTTGWDARPFHEVDLTTYSFVRLVRDAVILVNALGYKEVACILGHDFGAVGASMCALFRPDIFKSTIIMSHPFKGTPKLPFNTINEPPSTTPKPNPLLAVLTDLAKLPEPRKHYSVYYSSAAANEEMTNPTEDLHSFLRGYFYLKSADWEGNNPHPLTSFSASELAKLPYYYVMPLASTMRTAVTTAISNEPATTITSKSSRWLPDSELAVYAAEWTRNGFQGGLNWYRISTTGLAARELELWAGKKIEVPSLFVSGKSDWGMWQEPGAVEAMEAGVSCADYRGTVVVEGAGHWVQQEQPEVLVQEVLKFLGGL